MKLQYFLVLLIPYVFSESIVDDNDPIYKDPIELPIYQDAIRRMLPNFTDIERDRFIVNGDIAVLGQFPYTVALHMRAQHGIFICGGSLIQHNWVLTVAHCIFGFNQVQVIAGAVNRIIGPSIFREIITSTNDLIIHPRYNPNTLVNDIALIRLRTSSQLLLLHPYVGTIDLPTDEDDRLDLAGRMGTVSGFGQTGDGFPPSEVLRFVDVPIITNDYCAKFFGNGVQPSNLCIDTTSRRSPCQGDSGGALTTQVDENRTVVVGIVSFGRIEGCSFGFPVAFVRVTYYLNWIEKTMNGGCRLKFGNFLIVGLGMVFGKILGLY